MLEVVLIVWIVISGMCLYLGFIRNYQVYKYTADLAGRLYSKQMGDVWECNLDDWEILRRVNHTTMVLKFWRPLDSFYPDDFLKYIGKKK